ncbi:hypothetical protein, partial [Salmonella enterica]|uniref:cadherin repeat domain-containing protein n=1 Tax=Salmonella enterica TaxID=28901 RepID=UPI003FA69555
PDAGRFAIDARTGLLHFVLPPSASTPTDADADGHYDVIVSASDGRQSATQRLTISVTADRTAPPLVEPSHPPAPGTAPPSPATPTADATPATSA